MKFLYLEVVNENHASWIVLKKEDDLPFVLPSGTIFEAVANFRGVVENHYYKCKENKFVTSIRVETVLSFQLKSFIKHLLGDDWEVIYKDDDLISRDGGGM